MVDAKKDMQYSHGATCGEFPEILDVDHFAVIFRSVDSVKP